MHHGHGQHAIVQVAEQGQGFGIGGLFPLHFYQRRDDHQVIFDAVINLAQAVPLFP